MVKIIETNLSIMDWDGEVIADHQSRVIEVSSWQDFIVEIKEAKTVERPSVIGSMHGNSVPRECRVDNLQYDEKHLSCDIIYGNGVKSKKLAYLAG
ncbi:hypothetical protein [Niallia taxi]|uniref:hypothetical protein n=1 Tax=Niallia taxi TaxID=2499688 RepID=UPI003009F24D